MGVINASWYGKAIPIYICCIKKLRGRIDSLKICWENSVNPEKLFGKEEKQKSTNLKDNLIRESVEAVLHAQHVSYGIADLDFLFGKNTEPLAQDKKEKTDNPSPESEFLDNHLFHTRNYV